MVGFPRKGGLLSLIAALAVGLHGFTDTTTGSPSGCVVLTVAPGFLAKGFERGYLFQRLKARSGRAIYVRWPGRAIV